METLYQFGAYSRNGSEPASELIQGRDGAFYGTTKFGGTNARGTVFKITADGELTVLHQFHALDVSSKNADGAHPTAALLEGKDGAFYGSTALGGVNATGVLFKITPDGGFTILHSFTATDSEQINSDGAFVNGALIEGRDGAFYGTAKLGGAHREGTLFKFAAGGTLTTLFSFDPAYSGTTFPGTGPNGLRFQGSDGSFYGTTTGNGAQGGVFHISETGTFIRGATFSGTIGDFPLAGVIRGGDGSYYGTTSRGGTNNTGTVFKISPTPQITTVYSFPALDANGFNTNGATPAASLILAGDGAFYGTASAGGPNGTGTLFRITPDGKLSTLHAFGAVTGSQRINPGGASPMAALLQSREGDFYGTTEEGGPAGAGTVFRYTAAGDFATLTSFVSVEPEGFSSPDGLLANPDGTFYGTTTNGGVGGTGTVFLLAADRTLRYLHDFSALVAGGHNPDGGNPRGPLARGADGNLYGVTTYGGAGGTGTVFRLTDQGQLTALHSFGAMAEGNVNADGVHPSAGLLAGGDGSLYGTTAEGGGYGKGVVFKFTPTGTLTVLHTFGALDEKGVNTEGIEPESSLSAGADGNLYGSTPVGGAYDKGTVFRLTPAGAFTVLHTFGALDADGDNSDGSYPEAGVVQGADGCFYGTTNQGGANSGGTVFQLTVDGTFKVLHAFTRATDGDFSMSGLLQGKDGNFYGMATSGGAHGEGTIFMITPAGKFTLLFAFQRDLSGERPAGRLVLGMDGTFYGTTEAGGLGDGGTVFELTTAAPVITSPAAATVTAGHVFTYLITASGNPRSFGAQSLAAGLALNGDSGLISGVPTAAGTFKVALNATNGVGTGTKTLVLTVKAPSPVITSVDTATALQGNAYVYHITATENPTKYGAAYLPAGLKIDQATGIISGAPTTTGVYAVTIAAFNNAGSGSGKLTLMVKAAAPKITSATTVAGTVAKPFAYQITATNSPTKYGESGLPAGLTINQATGRISGTPAKAGSYNVTIAAFNATGSGAARLALNIQ